MSDVASTVSSTRVYLTDHFSAPMITWRIWVMGHSACLCFFTTTVVKQTQTSLITESTKLMSKFRSPNLN